MKDGSKNTNGADDPVLPAVVDRAAWQARIDELRVKEKAHTRAGDALAAERRRLPMVEVDQRTPPIGVDGPVPLIDIFDGLSQLMAYFLMWHTGKPAAKPCHEIPDGRERREAVVTLYEEGWANKSIAGYLRVDRSTVYRARRRFEEEGEEGLRDRSTGRPRGVHKVDLRAMNEVRKLQENQELGAFRVHAALELRGIRPSPRTVGRILARPGGGGFGEAFQGAKARAGDALRGVPPPRVLDLRRALRNALHPRNRPGLRGGHPGELLAGHPR